MMKKTILIALTLFAGSLFAESIANLELPEHSATLPARVGSGSSGWWINTHNRQVKAKEALSDVQMIFVGASVVQHWTSGTIRNYQRGKAVWDEHFAPRDALNFGIAGDKTQNALWRLQNGALDGISPKVAIVAVGFNNKNDTQEISEGMLAVLREIRQRCPDTRILFMPYFPTTNPGWRNGRSFQAYDRACKEAKDDEMIIPLEISDAFVNDKGVLKDPALIPDNLHPAESGYQLWYEAMEPTLARLLAGKK